MTARGVDFTGLAYLAALGLGAALVFELVRRGPAAAKEAADKVASGLNPTNPENIFALGANAATRAVTGDEYDTFGTALWRFFNPDKVAAERTALAASEVTPKASSVNPQTLTPSGSGGEFIARYHADYTGTWGEQIPLIGGPDFN